MTTYLKSIVCSFCLCMTCLLCAQNHNTFQYTLYDLLWRLEHSAQPLGTDPCICVYNIRILFIYNICMEIVRIVHYKSLIAYRLLLIVCCLSVQIILLLYDVLFCLTPLPSNTHPVIQSSYGDQPLLYRIYILYI